MGQSQPLFVYFRSSLITISIIQIEKSVDGVHGIWTHGLRIVGADKATELWRPNTKYRQMCSKAAPVNYIIIGTKDHKYCECNFCLDFFSSEDTGFDPKPVFCICSSIISSIISSSTPFTQNMISKWNDESKQKLFKVNNCINLSLCLCLPNIELQWLK